MSYERHGSQGARDADNASTSQAKGSAPGKRAPVSGLSMRATGGTRDAAGSAGTDDPVARDLVGPGYGSPVPPVDDEGGSQPLPHRQEMERAFGEDFSDLTVTLGAAPALDSIGASAATDGTAVAFSSTDPDREEVAHELAHVVQRRRNGGGGGAEQSDEEDPAEAEADLVAARVARGQEPGAVKERADALIHRRPPSSQLHPQASAEVLRRYDAFINGIYAAARRIVTANIQAVEAWRNYIFNQLTPNQMAGQVYGTAFEQLQGQAAANNAEFLLPYYAAEPNPIRQQLYEHQMAGQWRACTGCHVSNQAWALDGRMRDEGNRGITPAELLSMHAGTPFVGGRSLDVSVFRDSGSWGAAFAPPQAPPQSGGPQQPPPSLPVHTPPAPLDPERNREESLAAARRALVAIQPHIQPLGDTGYKIIPSNVISRFGSAPIEELRTALEAAFSRRLSGYQQLMGRIGSQSIDYLEFDTLVTMLKPMAATDVQGLIDDDKRQHERQEIVEFVGLLLLDLISIVLPPVALVAGALHMVHGANQMVVGNDRNNATGLHGMMSPERQASGQMMMMGGALEVMGGAVQVAMATASLGRMGGAGRVISTARQGDITLELMENGVVRATHAGYPGKSIIMQADGSFQALDELGNVVGNGVVGRGGGANAAAEAWGTPGQAPAGTSLARVPPANSNLATVPPTTGLAPRPPWPAISPFYTGGSGPGTLQPTPYNPCGRADNCGFSSMSYAQSLQNPNAPLRTADDLYLERLQQLGFTPDDNISRQLVFPERSYDGLRPRPGYGPLFDDGGGNRLADWTLPTTARSLGIPGTEANDALRRWQTAYGRHATIEEAVQARIEFLEQNGNSCPNPTAVRAWIEAARAELPGTYIVGSRSSAHYLTVTIDPSGAISGFDPQSGAQFGSLEAVQARMGQGGFDMMYKVTLPLPPTGAPP